MAARSSGLSKEIAEDQHRQDLENAKQQDKQKLEGIIREDQTIIRSGSPIGQAKRAVVSSWFGHHRMMTFSPLFQYHWKEKLG